LAVRDTGQLIGRGDTSLVSRRGGSRPPYLRSLDQENDCADIGISAPSAKLI